MNINNLPKNIDKGLSFNDISNNSKGPKQRSWTKEAVREDQGGFGIFGDLAKLSQTLPTL